MTETEFKHKISVIETEYLQSKKQLFFDYAKSQRIFEIGDIIKDISGTIIEVQNYGFYVSFNNSVPTYFGIELRKYLLPKKKNNTIIIYGNVGVQILKKKN